MSFSDAWTQQHAEGFALAATAQSDREAHLALPGLAAEVRARASSVSSSIAALDKAERRRWVRDMLEPRPITSLHSALGPARAFALIATSAERTLGRRWIAESPPPRPGFRADPGLLALLRRLLQQTTELTDVSSGGSS